MDVTIRICGSAGDGAISAGELLNRAVAGMGYHIMNFDSYPAEIRGFGKTVAHTRISLDRVLTPGPDADILIALNDPHAITELGSLSDRGVLIYDSRPPDYLEEDQAVAGFVEPGMIGYGIPLRDLSIQAVQSARSRNIVALGALAGIIRLPPEGFRTALEGRFTRKGEAVLQGNLEAFDLGYRFGRDELAKSDPVDFRDGACEQAGDVRIISGNEAVARGCIEAGLRLYAGYPITPATKIMEILAKELPRHGGVVIQTEDEIAAIGHVVGGGFAGKRSATATSGPGLALMGEMLGLAVVAEIPSLVVNSMRGGPSTGLPTKTEQSDLALAIFGGSGDSPRPVLAPANVQECRELTRAAFQVAEVYQTPVILLLDFFLSNRIEDVSWPEKPEIQVEEWAPVEAPDEAAQFRRFEITESGVSPRSIPGRPGLGFAATGLEHDERGRPEYSRENHIRMSAKRHRKMEHLRQRWPDPEPVGPEGELEVGILSWGSSIGAAMEALELLQNLGLRVGGFFPRLVWPLPREALEAFASRCGRLVVAEMNHEGQFARLVEAAIHRPVQRVARVDAAPLSAAVIAEAARGDEG